MIAQLLNTAWMWQARAAAIRFGQSCRQVAHAQEAVLLNIIRRNQSSDFGRRYHFDRIRSVAEFRDCVPCTDYEQQREAIERISAGEPNVLTSEPVLLLEPTSGSAAAAKLIPYTKSLRTQFQHALNAWIWDTFDRYPAVRRGRAYWSITPLHQRAERTSGGLPIGFETDCEYLGGWQRFAAKKLMVVPAGIARLKSMENARYVTLCHLLAASDVTLFSVWSPLFLLALLDQVPAWWESICDDLTTGIGRFPQPSAESDTGPFSLPANAARARQLRALFQAGFHGETWSRCWPDLALVSCWGDAASESYLTNLRRLWPQAIVQPKGLLATEGVVTIPWRDGPGGALALPSHFFEFQKLDTSSALLLAHELSLGSCYRVHLTTGGGLYRYDLGDVVEVVGFVDECPRLRFVGRAAAVSDLVGEKLHEEHVRRSMETVWRHIGLAPEFALLVPEKSPWPHYCLYVAGINPGAADVVTGRIVDQLEQRLNENPQYLLARQLKQLTEIQVKVLTIPVARLWAKYECWHAVNGRRIGDLKLSALDTNQEWINILHECS